MRFKKKIFEIGAEMTEKIEIKVLAPFARVHRKKLGLSRYIFAIEKVGINENFKPL